MNKPNAVCRYVNGLENVAMKILQEAREAKNNPQSPGFIERNKFKKIAITATRILEDVKYLVESPMSKHAIMITSMGERALKKWEKSKK